MSKSYKIAIVPFDAWGCINPCLGIAQTLSRMGHHCVFVVNQNWPQVIAKNGFECRVYEEESKKNSSNHYWNDFVSAIGQHLKKSAIEKVRQVDAKILHMSVEQIKAFHHKMLDILLDLKPDGIVADTFVTFPAVQLVGVPWILNISGNALYWLHDQRLPPGGSGLPTNGDKQLWNEFYNEVIAANDKEWTDFNEWLRSVGAPQLQHTGKFIDPSPYLNIICCPKELSYQDIAPVDPKQYIYTDNYLRDIESYDLVDYNKFEIPEQLKNKHGKLVYLSMGSLACSDLHIMRRLVSILSKSKHRFIVSKGPFGDQLELSDHMWGQKSLPQLQVLRVVDAVITHGGNNTVSECMAAGTPMIVCPMFSDQYDNAQRVQEKGLGLRMDVFLCTESELLSAVDSIVSDTELKAKCSAISERIKRDNSKQRAAQRIVEVIVNNKN